MSVIWLWCTIKVLLVLRYMSNLTLVRCALTLLRYMSDLTLVRCALKGTCLIWLVRCALTLLRYMSDLTLVHCALTIKVHVWSDFGALCTQRYMSLVRSALGTIKVHVSDPTLVCCALRLGCTANFALTLVRSALRRGCELPQKINCKHTEQ